jgi:hypothetical protein
MTVPSWLTPYASALAPALKAPNSVTAPVKDAQEKALNSPRVARDEPTMVAPSPLIP